MPDESRNPFLGRREVAAILRTEVQLVGNPRAGLRVPCALGFGAVFPRLSFSFAEMPYGEIDTKSLGHGKELTSEPCFKKLKSTKEAYVFSHHRIQEKTGNDRAPVTVFDVKGNGHPQKDKTKTVLLKPLCDVMPGNRPAVVESIDSQISLGSNSMVVSSDDGIYSTSKAFIGPIYKPPEKKKYNERRNQTDTISGINDKGGLEEKPKFNSKKSEIDNELFQFYKEIEELENEKDDVEGTCEEPEPSQEQLTPYSQGHHNDLVKSGEEKKDLSNALQSHCGYQQYLGTEPDKYPYKGQVIPTFCDVSFTSFRPEWQSVRSFIVPHGPPALPSFSYHSNIQRFHAPLSPPPNIFHAQGDCQVPNGNSVDRCHFNWNCLTSAQNNKYIDCSRNGNSVQPSRNSYSVQDGYVSNGFCETGEEYWEDPFVDKLIGTDRFMNQHCQEEKLNKLQKLLILLRGLPGSGKTTLSRVLLAQSRDGIVFSTDDYFHHQDGYSYNVTQLGDAHDWNQNRAKQAIAQGISPVIIDNTNTQAWEMKPYVEMAIGKGYRVEFHEPETWWKFDPEELEKRNKHGVSRKKIAQMLDRYEYQMSISIVMNSVEPPNKGTQRPPPPQWRQRERDLKKTGHGLSKIKQQRNRKRNKKQTGLHGIMEKNSLGTLSCLPPGAQHPSPREDKGLEGTKRESKQSLPGGLEYKLRDFVNGYKEERWKNINHEEGFPNMVSIVELYNTPKNYLLKGGDSLFVNLSSIPNERSAPCQTVTQNLLCATGDDCSAIDREKHVENRRAMALDCQDRFAEAPCSLMQGREMENESVPSETKLCHQHGSKTSDKVSREEQGANTTETNSWAFFSINLSDEELQLGSDRQHYFGGWSERPHQIICEQRPKRDRWHRLTSPGKRGGLLKLISTSEGASVSESPEILIEEKRLIEDKNLLFPTENIDSLIEIETNIFSNCSPQLDIPKNALVSTGNRKRRQRRIFNLAPNFDLPRHTNISVKGREEGVLLMKSHTLETVLGEEKDRISVINKEEENKQKLMVFGCHPSWFCLDSIQDPPLNIGGQFNSHCLSFNKLRCSMYFYNSLIPSLVLQHSPSFWKVPFASKKLSVTYQSQTKVDNELNDIGLISSEIFSSQPDTLYSFKVTSDLHLLNERSGEKLKRREEPKPLQCLQTEENQDPTSTNFNSLGLPLSKAFAFQLVKLFGSPGVPLESLLPDDYVVPLDWKTLKMIYLQWKSSVQLVAPVWWSCRGPWLSRKVGVLEDACRSPEVPSLAPPLRKWFSSAPQ
ncbi:NEDD4-binding protein 2-like 2 isoform X2 [Dasypus novemcinctus]|uniref:NEDD4-binding protein 2-like 2 isoform X2 n=1 Tax=Dasypus novemcinctus TaxID=9361 RepID=UPI00265E1F08|nr:NEDD4-binding protein 2-like 2 isoform X2 [Dasypus novemcinctus]